MTAPDAPQVEPLTLTLEEAMAKLAGRGYTLAVHHHHEDAPRECVLHDIYGGFALDSFGHWKDAVEAVLGVPVVPRDDTAELVEALTQCRNELEEAKELLEDTSYYIPESIGQAIDAALAALARVKGGER